MQAKLVVYSPLPGVVTTPRLKEKVGQYVREGELICLVEEPDAVEVEIAVPEQDAGRVRVGQPVGLKARSLVNETFTARVDRIAPAAVTGDGQSTMTVYCRLEGTPLRPGMSGYAARVRGTAVGRRVPDEPGCAVCADGVLVVTRTFALWQPSEQRPRTTAGP